MSYLSEAKSINEMVLIPGGSYQPLFKSLNNITNSIIVQDFYLDKYPVTNGEFYEFVSNKTEWNVKNIKSIFADDNYLNQWADLNNFNAINNIPVVNISWFAAEAYCKYVNKRLPLLDEWEYVAVASDVSSNSKNDLVYLKKILDWYTKDKIKSFLNNEEMEKNYWGVYDMHSGIWEWVYDFNSIILINTDSEGGGLEEILYCGAVATNSIDPSDYLSFMRFAFRSSLEANYTITTLGFRCAKDVD